MPKKIMKEVRVGINSMRVRKLIERANLTYQKFAKQCSLTPTRLSLFLSNKQEPSPSIRISLLSELRKLYRNVTWEDIFYFEDEKKEKQEK